MSELASGVRASGGNPAAPVLVELLHNASVEISAGSAKALTHLHEHFDPGTEVFVNFLPGGDWRPVADTAAALRRAGFRPVPHIAARTIASREALTEFLSRLAGEAAVDRVLVIAGDGTRAAGPFSSSLAVIDSGLLEWAGVRTVGVAGHPEGHPSVAGDVLTGALREKQVAAARAGLGLFVVTQFAFEAAPVLAWLQAIRLAGVDAPVRIGVAGPATVATLVRFGMRCGIGNSLRAVRMRPNAVGRLLGKSAPDELIVELGVGLAAMQDHGVAGLHFFPFGGIAETGGFVAGALAELYAEISPTAAPAS